jgi:hypothetical protein
LGVGEIADEVGTLFPAAFRACSAKCKPSKTMPPTSDAMENHPSRLRLELRAPKKYLTVAPRSYVKPPPTFQHGKSIIGSAFELPRALLAFPSVVIRW